MRQTKEERMEKKMAEERKHWASGELENAHKRCWIFAYDENEDFADSYDVDTEENVWKLMESFLEGKDFDYDWIPQYTVVIN